ncbi:MAG: metallophosphoesterase family protein [Pseudomonadota bacterium]
MLAKLFNRPRPAPAPTRLARPIYAIGDLHGEAELATQLVQQIASEIDGLEAGADVVFLGDYIDRGPRSRQTLDGLLETERAFKQRGCAVHLVLGNHEVKFLRFLEYPVNNRDWLMMGGTATLKSYGIEVATPYVSDRQAKALAAELEYAMPSSHAELMHRLSPYVVLGPYFFCHAGVDPERPLNRQLEKDLTAIREPFLSWRQPLEKLIVHGHTPTERPYCDGVRIGIDTGAYYSGVLTGVVLTDNAPRFLTAERLMAAI